MTTVTAGSSQTFTCGAKGSQFTVQANGGGVGLVVGVVNGRAISPVQIGPTQFMMSFGPLDVSDYITVQMQIGVASVSGGNGLRGDPSNDGVLKVAPGTVVLLGDSRNAQHTTGAAVDNGMQRTKTAWNYFTWFQALNNQPMRVLAKLAVSGSQTSALDGQITQMLLLPVLPQYAIIVSGTNDFMPGVAANVTAANVINACSRLLANGVTPIPFLDTGSAAIGTAAGLQWLFEVNQRIREYCESDRRILMYDPTPVLWDPSASTWTSTPAVTFRSGYMADATHTNALGAYYLGVGFGTWAASVGIIKEFEARISAIAEMVTASNPKALIANGMFTTTTGGTTQQSGSVTGNVPGNWNLKKGSSAGTATTITTGANSSGFGNDLTLTITTTGADTVALTQDAAAAVKNAVAIGESVQATWELTVSSGTNLLGVNVVHEYNDGSATTVFYDLYNTGGANGPQAYGPVTGQPLPMPILASLNGVGWLTTRIEAVFSGAGGATVLIRRVKHNKRFQ